MADVADEVALRFPVQGVTKKFKIQGGKKEYNSYEEAEYALKKAIENAKNLEDKKNLEGLKITDLADNLISNLEQSAFQGNAQERGRLANEQMQAEIEAARLAQIQEDNPILSKLFPGLAKSMAKSGQEGTTGKGNYLASVGDNLSLPGRAIAAGIDKGLGNSDYMESLGQTRNESEHIPGSEGERNIGGKMVQGILRDPMTLPLAIAGGPVASAGIKAAMPIAQKLGAGAAIGAGFGLSSGLIRPFLENAEHDAKDIAFEAGISGVAGGVLPLVARLNPFGKVSPEQFEKRLADVAWKLKVKPEALRQALTPEGQQMMAQNADPAKIAKDLLEYGGFNKAVEAENNIVKDAFVRSDSKIKPDAANDVLVNYENRVKKEAGGGGLTSEEEAAAKGLKREADILYSEGELREMNAQQLSNARKRIGNLIDSEWKKTNLTGKPDAEVAELKKAYHALKEHMIAILEKDGEKEAVEAYRKIADMMGSRDALFNSLAIGNNKYKTADALTKKLRNIEDNPYKTELNQQLENFDKSYNENFKDRISSQNNFKNLGGQVNPNGELVLPNDNMHFTGKGKDSTPKKLYNSIAGGLGFGTNTVRSAAKNLGNMQKRIGTPADGSFGLTALMLTKNGLVPIELPSKKWNNVNDIK
jgi:hypothetical protein